MFTLTLSGGLASKGCLHHNKAAKGNPQGLLKYPHQPVPDKKQSPGAASTFMSNEFITAAELFRPVGNRFSPHESGLAADTLSQSLGVGRDDAALSQS